MANQDRKENINIQLVKAIAILALFGVGIFVLIQYLLAATVVEPDDTWVAAVGEVTRVNWSKGGCQTTLRYRYNEIEYEGSGAGTNVNSYNARRSKYRILINPQKPAQFLLRQWSPVLERYLPTDTAVGTISQIYKASPLFSHSDSVTYFSIKFTYEVADLIYEFAQDLPPLYPNPDGFQVGQRYKVAYSTDYPQRSIIYFDKPVRQ